MKKALVGAYLLCALVYFAFMSQRLTADPNGQHSYTTFKIQSLMLAGESLIFPFYLAYFYLQDQNPLDVPVQPAITPSNSVDRNN